LKYARRLTRRT